MTPYSGVFGRRELQWLIDEEDALGLIEALRQEKIQSSEGMRGRVVRELGLLGDPCAVEPLSEVLINDPAAPVRGLAAVALGAINNADGLPALRHALADVSTANQMWAIQSLGRMRDRDSVDRLIERLGSADAGVRKFAAYALGEIGDHRATQPLVDSLNDSTRKVQKAAAEALARLGDSRALEPVRRAYEQANFLSRRLFGPALKTLESRFG